MGDSQSGFLNLKSFGRIRRSHRILRGQCSGQQAAQLAALRRVGGNVQTPKGWSLVSFGLALISDFASRTNPALRASSG